jgi:outer membrane protein assembly factor BamD (BamD/ComL family)
MLKKIIIVLVVVLVGGVIFMPEITAVMARTAVEPKNQSASWAPGMAYSAAKINLRFFRFKTAAKIYERCIETWPEADWQAEAHYQVAISYEKDGDGKKAIDLYNVFLRKYPDHHWKEQAEKRITNIQANML